MTLAIEQVDLATTEKWDETWRHCLFATFFHSREWAEIWNAYSSGGLYPAPLLFHFSDGVEAVFPISVRKCCHGFLEEYVSSPAGTFGGWLPCNAVSTQHAQLMIDHLRNEKSGLMLRLNPYDEVSATLALEGAAMDWTHTLDLRPGFDAVYREISKGHRSAAKKASRSGITVTEHCRDEDWDEYYAVYEDSLRRWGNKATSRYSMKLFSEIRRRKSPNIKLWLARYNGQVVAGAICLYSRAHVVYWHGAALEHYFELRGTNLLLEEAIRHACRHQYHWFDFNPSGGHEGPRAFKEHFGAKPLPCPIIHIRSKALRIAARLRNSPSCRWLIESMDFVS